MGLYREVKTELQERSYEARIWWALWGIALVVLIFTVWHQILEFDLIRNGHCFEAEFYISNGKELARYRDENNRYRIHNISSLYTLHEENTIKMYYKDDIEQAQPRMHPGVWIIAYLLFGSMFVGCSFKLRRIYRETLYRTII